MRSYRHMVAAAVTLAAFGVVGAHADFWQDAFRGLDLLATPSGGPLNLTGDGTRVNGARSGRVRVVPNGPFSNGYRLEFDRGFGADSRGRPEVFRLPGVGELTLTGNIQLTAGYDDLGQWWKAGTANLGISNLGYVLRTNNNGQDIELSGTLNAGSNLEINQYGFYSLVVQASNTNSVLTVDGVVLRDEQPTNFDVGPIVIEGNLFVDAALGLLTALGVDTSQFEDIFPKSPAGQLDDAIATGLQGVQADANAAAVAGAADFAPLLLQTVLNGDAEAAAQLSEGLAEGTLRGTAESSQALPTVPVPEPGILVLMALGGGVMLRYRRPS